MESPPDQIVSTGKIPPIDASVLSGPEEHQIDAIAQPPADKPTTLPAADRGMSTDLDKMLPGLLAQAQVAERSKAEAGKEQALSEAEETAKYRTGAKDLYAKDKPAAFNPGAPPQKPNEDPLRQFGSLASMIGIFASAFTKKPIVNALNASSAAMNAQRAGDKEAYDIAYKEWQDQIKLGMEKHKMDTEDLNTGLNMLTTDYSAGMAYFKALGAAKSWDAVSALAQIGDATEIGKLHASLITAGNKATENNIRMQALLLKGQKGLREQQVYDDTLEAFKKTHPDATPEQAAMAEAKALRASQGKSAGGITPNERVKLTLMNNSIDGALDDVDSAIDLINHNFAIAGLPGSARQYAEPLSNLFGSDATAEALFKQKIATLKMKLPGLERAGAARGLKADEVYLNDIIGGTGFKNSAANTLARLEALRDGTLMKTRKTVQDLLEGEDENSNTTTEQDDSGSWEDAPVVTPAEE